jgi:hypothetical protein
MQAIKPLDVVTRTTKSLYTSRGSWFRALAFSTRVRLAEQVRHGR